jgi:hypothetical protein
MVKCGLLFAKYQAAGAIDDVELCSGLLCGNRIVKHKAGLMADSGLS